MLDLDKLAQDLRNQGENVVEVERGQLRLFGGCDEREGYGLCCGAEWLVVEDTGDIWTGDDWPPEPMLVYPYLVIVAKHLDAVSSVATARDEVK